MGVAKVDVDIQQLFSKQNNLREPHGSTWNCGLGCFPTSMDYVQHY